MKRSTFFHAAFLALALAFAYSCSDDSSSGGGGEPSSSSLALPSSSSSGSLSSSVVASSSSSEELSSSSEILSSSSETLSSSSEISSSSSSFSSSSLTTSSSSSVDLCAGFLDGSRRMHYGRNKQQFCDKRDGKKYVYVIIEELMWMAENVNYRMYDAFLDKDFDSGCYGNLQSNCEKMGRLYAFNIAGAGNACPEGWRLPTTDDWAKLMIDAGGTANAGRNLKAKEGWENCGPASDEVPKQYACEDSLGFAAIPGGYAGSSNPLNSFNGLTDANGNYTARWIGGNNDGGNYDLSTSYQYKYRVEITRNLATASAGGGSSTMTTAASVRCVKNVEVSQ